MKEYDINIFRINNSYQKYNYKLNEIFFALYENNLIEKGKIEVEVIISEDTKKNILSFKFDIKGTIELICDRSLEEFSYPINIKKEVIFEFGEQTKELNIDHYMIDSETTYINIAQHLYDFIILEAPIKKLHPKFDSERIE